MSDENSSEDVTEKVKALEKEYAALRSAMTRSRFTRLIIFLGAVGLVAVIGWMFYSFAIDVTSSDYQEKLLSMAKERLEKNKDGYLKQVQKLVDHSAPKLKDAFYKPPHPWDALNEQLLRHSDASRKALFIGYLKDGFCKPLHSSDAICFLI